MRIFKPELEKQAEEWEGINNYDLIDVVAYVYSEIGEADKVPYFQENALEGEGRYTKLYSIYYVSYRSSDVFI